MKTLKKIVLGGSAAIGITALALGIGAPAMAVGDFGAPTLEGPSSTKMSAFAPNGKLDYTLRFSGSDDASYAAKASVSLLAKNSSIPGKYTLNALSISGQEYTLAVKPSPETNKIYAETNIYTSSYFLTTPGKYQVAVTLTPSFDATPLVVAKDVTVTADTFMSELISGPTWRKTTPGKPLSISLYVPYYQVGAKITAKFKAAGSSKWRTVARGIAKNSNPVLAKASLKVSGKYTKKAGAFKFTVGSVSYSSGYTTDSTKFKPKKAQRF